MSFQEAKELKKDILSNNEFYLPEVKIINIHSLYAGGGGIENSKEWKEYQVASNNINRFNRQNEFIMVDGKAVMNDVTKMPEYKILNEKFKESLRKVREMEKKGNNSYAEGGEAGNEPYAKRIYSKTSWEKITKFLNKIYTEEQTDLILHSKLMRYPEKETFEGFVDFFWKYEEKFDELLKENGLEDKDEEEFAEGGEAGMIYLISDNATPKREIKISEDDILIESKKFFKWKNA